MPRPATLRPLGRDPQLVCCSRPGACCSRPVRLDVPDTAGRYYVLQFVDAWTNNFAYVGHRATGEAAFDGRYELPPITKSP
jgi:Protein of unknown function (DUF1254)